MYDFVLAVSTICFLAVIFFYARHPAASLLHPVTFYLGFHGLVFVIRPILARIYDFQSLYIYAGFQPTLSDKVTVIIAANLALFVFAGVGLAFAGQALSHVRTAADETERARLARPLVLAMLVLAPIGLASTFQNWGVVEDNWSAMDVVDGVIINRNVNGWFWAAQLALVPLVVAFAWVFRFRWWSFLPFAIFFVLRAGTGGRGPLVVAAIAIVVLFLFERRRHWPDWRGVALVVLAMLAFNVVGSDRGQSVRNVITGGDGASRVTEHQLGPLERMDFGNLEFFEYLVYAVPQRSGTYDYFLGNLQILTEPVPRVWWPDKPVGAPIQLFNLHDYGRPTGFTWSVPGAGWLALGYPGVAIQAALFALIYGLLYRQLVQGRQSSLYLLFYAVMVAATIITFRNGTFISIVRVLPFYVGPLVLIWLLDRIFAFRRGEPLFHWGGQRQPVAMPDREQAAAPLTPAERRRRLAGTLGP